MEIERKYLVTHLQEFPKTEPSFIVQAYLFNWPFTARVRLRNGKAYFTAKGKTVGISRTEVEFRVPYLFAKFVVSLIKTKIVKTRHEILYSGKLWELDIFHGANEGLVVAEIELKSEDEQVDIPGWCGREVSSEARYYNSNLIKHPYKEW